MQTAGARLALYSGMDKEQANNNIVLGPPPTICTLVTAAEGFCIPNHRSLQASSSPSFREAFGLDFSDPHFFLLMKSLFLEKAPYVPQNYDGT